MFDKKGRYVITNSYPIAVGTSIRCIAPDKKVYDGVVTKCVQNKNYYFDITITKQKINLEG